MDLMTAAMTCLKLTEREKIWKLTAKEKQELADARKFLTDGPIQKTPIKVYDPCGLLP